MGAVFCLLLHRYLLLDLGVKPLDDKPILGVALYLRILGPCLQIAYRLLLPLLDALVLDFEVFV